MRAETSVDEPLEPLPVVVDGVAVAPVWAATPSFTDVVPLVLEAADAICARILETSEPAARRPWLRPQSSGSEARPPAPPTTFSRLFELHVDHLASLPHWWEQHARNERVTIGRRLSLRAPRCTADDVWTMRASLRVPWRVRPVGMDASLWRHLGGCTKLTLQPRCRVYIKAFYFQAGHRALDVLCDRLVRELQSS